MAVTDEPFILITCAFAWAAVLVFGAVYVFHPGLFFVAYVRVAQWSAGVTKRSSRVGKVAWVYAERGQRTPGNSTLVFVHGFSAGRDSWNWVIKKLPRSLHIIAVDLPGHGDTRPDPDDDMERLYEYYVINLRELMINLRLDKSPIHLVGLSMGGGISGLYAAVYPAHVQEITFICPGMVTPVESKMEADRGAVGVGQRPSLVAETAEDQQWSLQYTMYKQMRFPKQFYKGMVDIRRKNVPFFKMLVNQFTNPHNEGVLNKAMGLVTAPAHILWGEEDYIVHVSGAEVLRKGLPDVQQFDVIPKCGHAMDIEMPGLVAQRIMKFRDTNTCHRCKSKKNK